MLVMTMVVKLMNEYQKVYKYISYVQKNRSLLDLIHYCGMTVSRGHSLLSGMIPRTRSLRTASRMCFGCSGPVSPYSSSTSSAAIGGRECNSGLFECVCVFADVKYLPSSTTSPTKTLAMPEMAMTTFCDTELPVIDCINCRK